MMLDASLHQQYFLSIDFCGSWKKKNLKKANFDILENLII